MHSTSSDAFINSCLTTIAHLIPVSAGVFYLVNQDLRTRTTIFCTAFPDRAPSAVFDPFSAD